MLDACPAPEPVRFTLQDGEMAGYRWSRANAPRLIFAHANGFNALTYRRLLAPLADEFDIIAVDLRGHGRSTLPADPSRHRSWDIHARDLAALVSSLDARETVLSGHSMGATSMLMATAHLARTPAGLVLVEPVVMPPLVYAMMHSPFGPAFSNRLTIVKNAKTRMEGWAAPEDAKARYDAKTMFSRWAPGMLEDYLEDGLVKRDGEWRLACRPAWEAANFAAQRNRPLAAARRTDAPIAVLKAGRGSTLRNAQGLLDAGATITERPEAGHLIAMENPQFTAEWLAAEAERCLHAKGSAR